MAQQTVNVVDVLNERIVMADEKIRAAQLRLQQLKQPMAANALGSGGYTLSAYVTIFFSICLILVALAIQAAFPGVLGAIGCALGWSLLVKAQARDSEMLRLSEEASLIRTSLDAAAAEREKLVNEKREYLLAEEHRMRQPQVTAVVTAHQAVAEAQVVAASDTIECPRCAETIKAKAKVCRFCGHELAGTSDG